MTAPDMVNHPPHYTDGAIECIDAIREALGQEGFVHYCRGNALEYVWRAGEKGALTEDLRKAAWYLTRAADTLDGPSHRDALEPKIAALDKADGLGVWNILRNDGTLADRVLFHHQATERAREFDKLYPDRAPYRVVPA